jgi:hypothetical protein
MVGLFDPSLREEAWFDETLIAESWFDEDLISEGIDATTGVGSSDGTATATAVGESVAVASASSSGAASPSAVGASTAVSGAVSVGTATAAASGESTAESSATASGEAAASAVGTGIVTAVGESDGAATAASVGVSTFAGLAVSTGTSSANATALSVAEASGDSSGSSAPVGVGLSSATAAGSVNSIASATAVGFSTNSAVGSISASAAVSAVGLSLFNGVGSSAGSSTTSSVGVAVFEAVGFSQGTSIATAEQAGAGIGEASSSSTASAVGASVAAASGSSIGASTAESEGVAIPIGSDAFEHFGASLRAIRQAYSDFTASLTALRDTVELKASITASTSTSTGPTLYKTLIAGSRLRGYYEVKIPYFYSPDLSAEIRGFYYQDIAASLEAWRRGSLDIKAIINAWHREVISDLGGVLQPYHLRDVLGEITAVIHANITGSVNTVPGVDLPANMIPIPGADLRVIAGGHFPATITASMSITQPVNIPAYIRAGYSSNSDIGGTLTPTGSYTHITGYIKPSINDYRDLPASLNVRYSPNITASIFGWVEADITASLITQRERSIKAIINGWSRLNEKDLSVSIRRSDADTKNLTAYTKPVISTHTSDKRPNLDKVLKTFPNNIYMFGSRSRGLYVLTIEPIYGNFPDLHAEIFAKQFYRDNIWASLKAAQRQYLDLGAPMVSVTSYININRINLSLVPSLDLSADTHTLSGYRPMSANVTPLRHAQTETDTEAGYSYTATSFRFFIGTSKGLYIPESVPSTIKVSSYVNSHQNPDLNAFVHGWHEANISASIKAYPSSSIAGSLNAYGFDRIKDFPVFLEPMYPKDITASINPFGAFENLLATVQSSGGFKNLTAQLLPVISADSIDILEISMQPFADMAAIINYTSLVSCSPSSAYSGIAGYVRAFISGSADNISNLSASIDASNENSDLIGTIVSRGRSRIRLLSLMFRARNRSNSLMLASITAVSRTYADVQASITGLSHEKDLIGSLTPVTLRPNKVTVNNIETVVDLKDTDNVKEILVSFRNQVSSYVFEDASSMVYVTDRGTWVVDLRTKLLEDSLYDNSARNKAIALTDVSEFYTLDEAIRNAIVLLTEGRSNDMTAAIAATGSIKQLQAEITGLTLDRSSTISAKIVPVDYLPDLAAEINTGEFSSAYKALFASISPETEEEAEIAAEVIGNIIDDLSVSITAV